MEGKKPEGAGTRCMADCPHVETCPYSTYLTYILQPERWDQYVWKCIEGEKDVDIERKKESMRTDNPYGRCVWDYNRDTNVESQTVIVNFENGAPGTFNMIGGAAKGSRSIHVVGTKGEIEGFMESNKYVLRKIHPTETTECTEEEFDVSDINNKSSHGGGDDNLTADFIKYLNGEEASVSCTDINDSTRSHLSVFKAEESRINEKISFIDKI